MKKALLTATTGLTALLVSVSASAATYTVNQAGNGVSAVGSITTDGTIGTLTQANITNWSFLLNDGAGTFQLNGPSNSQLLYSGSGLTSTATGLFFNFSANGFVLFQNPFIGSSIDFVCFAGNSVCGGDSNRISVTVSRFGGGIPEAGVQQIGTLAAGVPETATWAMMIAGFGAVGFAMRRSRPVRTTVRFA